MKIWLSCFDINVNLQSGVNNPRNSNKAASIKSTKAIVKVQKRIQNVDYHSQQKSMRLRYNLPLQDILSTCACGEPINISHASSCKKWGFVAQHHHWVRNLLTSLLSKVCKKVQVEPYLQPLDNELKISHNKFRREIGSAGWWLLVARSDSYFLYQNDACQLQD